MAKAGARDRRAKIVFSDFRMGCFSVKSATDLYLEEKICVDCKLGLERFFVCYRESHRWITSSGRWRCFLDRGDKECLKFTNQYRYVKDGEFDSSNLPCCTTQASEQRIQVSSLARPELSCQEKWSNSLSSLQSQNTSSRSKGERGQNLQKAQGSKEGASSIRQPK